MSVFKLFLFIGEDTVLRIPIRESSKDWRWKGKAHTLAAHEKSTDDKTKGRQGLGGDAASRGITRPLRMFVRLAGSMSKLPVILLLTTRWIWSLPMKASVTS